MTANFYIRHSMGFAMQLIPGCVLLLLSFDEGSFRKSIRFSYTMLMAVAIIFSLIFPIAIYAINTDPAHEQLSANLYMLIAIFAVTLIYFYIVSETWFRKLSLSRTKETEQAIYNTILKQSYDEIRRSMDKQRVQLHDVRQLLATMSSIAENGTREELLEYIKETTERTKRTDIRYCLDPCLNGILQYYTGILESSGISFTVKADCDKLPFDDADVTILISNAMENAIRSTLDHMKQNPADTPKEIRFTAGIVLGEFAVQIENPCVFASVSHRYNKVAGTFLPAEAFISTTGSGVGLRRMENIAEKYSGNASFCFDCTHQTFTTRITLSMHENGGKAEYAHWYL